jgi:hypothetical protein
MCSRSLPAPRRRARRVRGPPLPGNRRRGFAPRPRPRGARQVRDDHAGERPWRASPWSSPTGPTRPPSGWPGGWWRWSTWAWQPRGRDRIAPELLQDEATPDALARALSPWSTRGRRGRALDGPGRGTVFARLAGPGTAAERVAALAAELLEDRESWRSVLAGRHRRPDACDDALMDGPVHGTPSRRYERFVARGEPVIFAVWHGRLLPLTYYHRGRGITGHDQPVQGRRVHRAAGGGMGVTDGPGLDQPGWQGGAA